MFTRYSLLLPICSDKKITLGVFTERIYVSQHLIYDMDE